MVLIEFGPFSHLLEKYEYIYNDFQKQSFLAILEQKPWAIFEEKAWAIAHGFDRFWAIFHTFWKNMNN